MSIPDLVLMALLLEDEDMFDLFAYEMLREDEERRNSVVPRRRMNNSAHTGEVWVHHLLTGHEQSCYNVFRVHPSMFLKLVDVLVGRSLIADSRYVSAKQQLAMFLYAVGHGVATNSLMEHFQHSSQTISYYVNKVAAAIASLRGDYIFQPTNINECHLQIANSDRFYPYFKDALGAIDGTHIPANVPYDDQPRFRNQKQVVTQNVMGAVSFDLLFQYACVGWEGSASDMRVLKWALSNGGFSVPRDKYYLVNAGYANTGAFLAPYHGRRYNLSSFRQRRHNLYENKEEKFNHRHAQLRNCVDRAFGVLKMRFQTLREGNMYPFATQKNIVWSCIIVHNFIRREQGYDYYFNAPIAEAVLGDGSVDEEAYNELSQEATADGEGLRERIANEMWASEDL